MRRWCRERLGRDVLAERHRLEPNVELGLRRRCLGGDLVGELLLADEPERAVAYEGIPSRMSVRTVSRNPGYGPGSDPGLSGWPGVTGLMALLPELRVLLVGARATPRKSRISGFSSR